MGKIILITGGARSGKSKFAEELVKSQGKPQAYIATAQIFDEEMKQRVALHKKRRADDWYTVEAPFNAENAIEQCQDFPAILFDCMTVYTSNIICSYDIEKLTPAKIQNKILTAIKKLIEAAKKHIGTTVFVTNEVGSGIVPENKLARQYRDIAGLCNQYTAQAADKVYFIVSGIPLKIK
ncbi:bifunctional adenosylcobinamide kinase/adenosylcobinamide-phosphate guanylyltransferase [Pectinatus sottacetonis]|uniref:bifunctional adenosylcobinamide kinase/adenosylcobinamide-phosphate guanylyltransferase n=1 Tax=Pectinatus sottacetonis TaxID=1002795 RepID=UPI0018C5B0B0|nr:bifunctional adenosylcobinamide kinase/adenosylcobinamide-phosphate guanylyltransferase [Pectinatus sottacetonis]